VNLMLLRAAHRAGGGGIRGTGGTAPGCCPQGRARPAASCVSAV